MKSIYDLKLHEDTSIHAMLNVIRVPGGWVYQSFTSYNNNEQISSVFVPFNNEFQIDNVNNSQ